MNVTFRYTESRHFSSSQQHSFLVCKRMTFVGMTEHIESGFV